MAFINREDLINYNRIIEEELDEITRDSDTIVEYCCKEAIATIASYLNDYYEVDILLSAEGDDRDSLLIGIALDIAIYKIVAACQAGIDMTDKRMRNNAAVQMLEKATQPLTDENSIYPDWPRRESTAEQKIYVINTRHKKNNYY